MKTGLVLEGGGMRGLYTIGILDALMEYNIPFDYVIGVSAGACNGVSYVSEQQGRGYRIDCDYLKDKRYVSIQNFIKTGSMFGMDFIFREIPEKLDPFDFETFLNSPTEFVTGVTELETGKPAYFGKLDNSYDMCTVLSASSSIPMFSPPVEFEGRLYLDGGTSDPIPFQKALKDGCDRLVIVRTRDRSYRKSPEGGALFYRRALRKYPGMIRCIDERHTVYNKQIECIERMERAGQAFVYAPENPVKISRFENDIHKLDFLYRDGWKDVEHTLPQLKEFLEL
ncbi:MAG: patatin family protein [Eubacteriales bacterium]|nr:patatin family protein [Eubacteriales bacterium]